jgi:hypothetical protein
MVSTVYLIIASLSVTDCCSAVSLELDAFSWFSSDVRASPNLYTHHIQCSSMSAYTRASSNSTEVQQQQLIMHVETELNKQAAYKHYTQSLHTSSS